MPPNNPFLIQGQAAPVNYMLPMLDMTQPKRQSVPIITEIIERPVLVIDETDKSVQERGLRGDSLLDSTIQDALSLDTSQVSKMLI